MLPIILVLTTALFAFACSKGATSESAPPSAVADPSSAATPADEAIEPAGTSSNVAGAYLVGCSSFTSVTYLKNPDEGEDITACIVLDAKGRRADVEVLKIEVKTGGVESVAEVVPKEVELSPWHAGAKIPPEKAALAEEFRVTVRAKDGAEIVLATPRADYPWREDPAFEAVVNLARTLACAFSFDCEAGFNTDPTGEVSKLLSLGLPFHLLIPTDTVVSPDIGLEGADKLCSDLGATLPIPKRPWVAVLSTSKVDARDRFAPVGPLFNFKGGFITGKGYWTVPNPTGTSSFTFAGRAVKAPLGDFASFDFNEFAWTGSKADGTYDPEAGSCADWTSTASDATGAAARKIDLFRPFDEQLARPCSRKARILCASLPEEPSEP